MLKSKYDNNNKFANMAILECYKSDSVYATIEELDNFDYEVKFDDNDDIVCIYDNQVNDIEIEVDCVESVFDYIENYLNDYTESCLISSDYEDEYIKCKNTVNIISQRR